MTVAWRPTASVATSSSTMREIPSGVPDVSQTWADVRMSGGCHLWTRNVRAVFRVYVRSRRESRREVLVLGHAGEDGAVVPKAFGFAVGGVRRISVVRYESRLVLTWQAGFPEAVETICQ